ncbi:MAG: hypothetical protein U5N85_02210 [Arcicella sp.]|nr:hypothetical protein [Arcicella sp.]
MKKKTKSFKFWTSEDVENTFDIKRQKNLPALTEWLDASGIVLSKETLSILDVLKDELLEYIEYLNEEELKVRFIGKIINLVRFDYLGRYRTFFGRQLTAETDEYILSGEVDFMVATGKMVPKQPFFFLHEYKQELKRDNDPLGQLLIAMVAAQTRNENDNPVFGCYVTGRLWFFVVLEGKNYSVSNGYNSSDADLTTIVTLLTKNKKYIEEQMVKLGL